MTLTEEQILLYLKRGENYREHLDKRRRFLEAELRKEERGQSGCVAEAKEQYDAEGRSIAEELRSLSLAETQYQTVMRALWRVEPEERVLLTRFYQDRLGASVIAGEMNISESTFWRRRKRAFASLVRECKGQ